MPDEPQFMAIRSSDPEYQQTIDDAQAALESFRSIAPSLIDTAAFPSIKTELVSADDRAFIWLAVEEVSAVGFIASVIQVPAALGAYSVGDRLEVPGSAVLDWMYHDESTLHGGYSIRYQRAHLSPEEHAGFDAHIGVTDYA